MTERNPQGPDQRAHERIRVNHEFKNIDAFLSEYVADISRGGVFIRSRAPLEIGTRVELRFTIILEDVETIEGEGEVVRCVSEGPNPGMGVVFTELTAPSKLVIERLLAARDALERSVIVVEDDSAMTSETPVHRLEPLDEDAGQD